MSTAWEAWVEQEATLRLGVSPNDARDLARSMTAFTSTHELKDHILSLFGDASMADEAVRRFPASHSSRPSPASQPPRGAPVGLRSKQRKSKKKLGPAQTAEASREVATSPPLPSQPALTAKEKSRSPPPSAESTQLSFASVAQINSGNMPKEHAEEERGAYLAKGDVEDAFYQGMAGKKGGKGKSKAPRLQGTVEEFVDAPSMGGGGGGRVPILVPHRVRKAKEKQAATLAGQRQACGCQGAYHVFVNNCTKCGRIACAAEGAGPCFFCNTHVALHSSVSGDANERVQGPAQGLQRWRQSSIAATATMIYDDQADYYASEAWLTPEERLQLRARLAAQEEARNREKNRIVFDLTGRRVVTGAEAVLEQPVTAPKGEFAFQSDDSAPNRSEITSDFRRLTREVREAAQRRGLVHVEAKLGKRVQHSLLPEREVEMDGAGNAEVVDSVDIEALVAQLDMSETEEKVGNAPAAIPLRAIVEEHTWDEEETVKVVDWAEKAHVTHLLFAPREDAYVCAQWRSPMSPPERSTLQKHAQIVQDAGLAFIYALHPRDLCQRGAYLGLEGRAEDAKLSAELSVLAHRMVDLLSLGVFDVVLYLDSRKPDGIDSPPPRVPPVAALASLARRQGAAISALMKRVTPSVPKGKQLRVSVRPEFAWSDTGEAVLVYWHLLSVSLPQGAALLLAAPSHALPDTSYVRKIRAVAGKRALHFFSPQSEKPLAHLWSPLSKEGARYISGLVIGGNLCDVLGQVATGSAMLAASSLDDVRAPLSVLSVLVEEKHAASLRALFSISPCLSVKCEALSLPKALEALLANPLHASASETKAASTWVKELIGHLEVIQTSPETSGHTWRRWLELVQALVAAHDAFIAWEAAKDDDSESEYREKATVALREADRVLRPALDLTEATVLIQPLLQHVASAPSGLVEGDDDATRSERRHLLEQCGAYLRALSGLRQSSGTSDAMERQELVEALSGLVRRVETSLWPTLAPTDLAGRWAFLTQFCAGRVRADEAPAITSHVPTNALLPPRVGLSRAPLASAATQGIILKSSKSEKKKSETIEGERPSIAGKLVSVRVPGLIYRQNYLTKSEEGEFLTLIDSLGWSRTLQRRTQQFGFTYDYSAMNKKQRDEPRLSRAPPFPAWLEELAERVHADGLMPWVPDQAILNEYQPGQGIAPHVDHIASFGEVVVTISLGSAVNMVFANTQRHDRQVVHVEPRSVLALTGDARYEWTHAIEATIVDTINGQSLRRARRVSITFRKALV